MRIAIYSMVIIAVLVAALLVIYLSNPQPPTMTKPELARFVVICQDSMCSVIAVNGERVKLIGNLSPMDAQDMASHLYNTLHKQ